MLLAAMVTLVMLNNLQAPVFKATEKTGMWLYSVQIYGGEHAQVETSSCEWLRAKRSAILRCQSTAPKDLLDKGRHLAAAGTFSVIWTIDDHGQIKAVVKTSLPDPEIKLTYYVAEQ